VAEKEKFSAHMERGGGGEYSEGRTLGVIIYGRANNLCQRVVYRQSENTKTKQENKQMNTKRAEKISDLPGGKDQILV